MGVGTRYPDTPIARSRWIKANRGLKNTLDAWKPYAFLEEVERGEGGRMVLTATVFLTNRECPYRCLMCDLWKNTLDGRVPNGAIAAQIRYALDNLPSFREGGMDRKEAQIKLYNAGSFFDAQAIPPEDYAEIAEAVSDFGRVIVECHPALIGERCLAFQRLLQGRLEIAVGLETAHPQVLEKLNKRINVESFRRAAAFLKQNDMELRVFLLLRPPFLTEAEGVDWTKRSLDVAFECGASVCCIIPTRDGNGAMEQLAENGEFAPPNLASLEEAVEYGLALNQGRVFADLWDIERFFTCDCSRARAGRLEQMNRTQQFEPPVICERREACQ